MHAGLPKKSDATPAVSTAGYARVLTATTCAIAAAFSALFFAFVLPALPPVVDLPKVALLDGLVNPTALGYTADTLATGLVLIAWIIYERVALGVRRGWIAILLCFVPGVVVGLTVYLLIRRSDRNALRGLHGASLLP